MIHLQPVDVKSESADIVITPRNFNDTSYLVEIKYCKAGSSDSIVEQLRSYAFGLPQLGNGNLRIEIATRNHQA